MDQYLIGMTWDMDGLVALRDTIIAVLEVAIGLGLVIFVHELGHFSVAKLCGVKCEKFYLGFDIGGLRFWRHRWGETEYGIGILPLGGYVKMLGQEDNPARLKEEIERAKLNVAIKDGDVVEVPPEVAKAEQALYDPRSFLAISVPKRMAIISAGVIMNLIFAFIIAVVAYKFGIRQIAAGVGQVMPGEAAWQSGFKVGDEIVEIAGRKIRRYRDLQEAISLGNLENGLEVTVSRNGKKEEITVTPDSTGLAPRIGILNPLSTKVVKKMATVGEPGSTTAEGKPVFEQGDQVIKIGDEPIRGYARIHELLAANPDKPLEVTVERKEKGSADGKGSKKREEVVIDLAPRPMLGLGLEMEIGEISAIQKDMLSPAMVAGLKPGDLICEVDGEPVGDPLTLPDRLRQRDSEVVALTIDPKGEKGPTKVWVKLHKTDWFAPPIIEGNPIAVPALGIAYQVSNRVQAVQPDSPAAKAGLQAGDEIVRARIIPPDAETLEKMKLQQSEFTIKFDDKQRNWPCFVYVSQAVAAGTTVELEWTRQGESHTATLTPEIVKGWYNPDRGLIFEPVYVHLTAASWGEAVVAGWDETLNATCLVYRTLHKLGSQISFKALGGPVLIFSAAKNAADEGIANLLIFLTMLSANLAVLNFLPIPLLDGGLMVLLLYEAIRGKPANEHVQVALTYVGLAFIILLTVWVLGLDVGLISRR